MSRSWSPTPPSLCRPSSPSGWSQTHRACYPISTLDHPDRSVSERRLSGARHPELVGDPRHRLARLDQIKHLATERDRVPPRHDYLLFISARDSSIPTARSPGQTNLTVRRYPHRSAPRSRRSETVTPWLQTSDRRRARRPAIGQWCESYATLLSALGRPRVHQRRAGRGQPRRDANQGRTDVRVLA